MKTKWFKVLTLTAALIFTSTTVAEVENGALEKTRERYLSFNKEEVVILVEKEQTDSIEFVRVLYDIEMNVRDISVDTQNTLISIDKNLESYLELLQNYGDFKDVSMRIGQVIKNKIEDGSVLTGDDLYFIKKTISIYYQLSQKLLSFAKVHHVKNVDLADRIAKANKNDPIVKSELIYSSGMILILDHFLELYPIYYGDGTLRRIVKSMFKNKEANLGNNKTFDDLIELLKDVVQVNKDKKFRSELYLLKVSYKDLTEMYEREERAEILIDLITTNKRINEIVDGTIDIPNKRYTFVDMFYEFANGFTDTLSKLIGNLSGSIKWRDGYLFENQVALKALHQTLKPMDILLEKTPFILTDKFIPGHFGHVAIYLGTKTQLQELNLWDHPSLEPYKHDIENGKVVLEAVRSGVRLATLEEFMKVDEIAIIRKNDILQNKKEVYEALFRGMLQIGKDYDFNFDVETLDKIVCSELIYLVFGNVAWPTKYQLQRNTISPDNIGEVLYYLGTKLTLETYFNAEKDRVLNPLTKFDLSPKLGFEADGKDENDQDIFAKKSTKCYTSFEYDETTKTRKLNRTCRVTKRRYVYQEFEVGTNY